MKQFLITTATIAVLSLPVYYFFNHGSAPAPVVRAVEAVTDQDTVGDTGWLTEEDKQRIIANTIEAQGDKTAKAMVDSMETIAAGLNVLEAEEPQGDPLAVRGTPAMSSDETHAMTVAVNAGAGSDARGVDLFGGDSGRPDTEETASNTDDDAAGGVASPSVIAIAAPDVIGTVGTGPSIRFIGSQFRVPRTALDLSGFDAFDESRLARDYPTSFLWFYLA
jgi:hypothetical protein